VGRFRTSPVQAVRLVYYRDLGALLIRSCLLPDAMPWARAKPMINNDYGRPRLFRAVHDSLRRALSTETRCAPRETWIPSSCLRGFRRLLVTGVRVSAKAFYSGCKLIFHSLLHFNSKKKSLLPGNRSRPHEYCLDTNYEHSRWTIRFWNHATDHAILLNLPLSEILILLPVRLPAFFFTALLGCWSAYCGGFRIFFDRRPSLSLALIAFLFGKRQMNPSNACLFLDFLSPLPWIKLLSHIIAKEDDLQIFILAAVVNVSCPQV